MSQLSMHPRLPSLCTAEPLTRLCRAQVTEVTAMQRGYTARPSDPQTLPCAGMYAGSQHCYPMTNHRAQSTVRPAGPLPAGWQGEVASPALGGPSFRPSVTSQEKNRAFRLCSPCSCHHPRPAAAAAGAWAACWRLFEPAPAQPPPQQPASAQLPHSHHSWVRWDFVLTHSRLTGEVWGLLPCGVPKDSDLSWANPRHTQCPTAPSTASPLACSLAALSTHFVCCAPPVMGNNARITYFVPVF